MKKIDRRIVIVVTLIFIIGLSYGLMRYLISLKEAPPVKASREMKRFVKVATVQYKSIISPLSEPGRVSSVKEVDIIAEASGKIIKSAIALKKASVFSKGDILFTIYTDEAALALKAKKSQFLNSLANLLPEIGFDFPEHEENFKIFFSSVDIDKSLPPLPEIMDEKMKIFLSSRNILSDYYSIKKDELQLDRYTVRAPFNGTYSDVYMEAGAYANTGNKIAHAICTDEMELEIPLERFNAKWAHIGDKVIVSSKLRKQEWTGTIIRKSQFVDKNTQSQSVFVKVKNHTDPPILVGEYLKVHFPGQKIPNAMEIPRNAVFNSDEVFVVVDGRLQKRNINIIKKNESTLIFNGLDEGEFLVIQALINVLEGTLVEIKESASGMEAREGQKRQKANKTK